MTRYFLFVFSIILLIHLGISTVVCAESTSEIEDLIVNKKYLSSYDLLEQKDPNNENPDMVILKVKILTNYYAYRFGTDIYALRDLEADETIDEVRGQKGSYMMQTLDIISVLKLLIDKHPDRGDLHFTLGKYYDSDICCDSEIAQTNDPMILASNHFIKAKANGFFDWRSLFVMGYSYLKSGDYNTAIPLFHDSIKLNDNYPQSKYNLAYAYLYINDRESALKYSLQAMDQYTEPSLKSDASRMAATIYEELGDTDNAIKYFEIADKTNPKNYYNLRGLVPLYLIKDKLNTAKHKAIELFNLQPENPTLAKDLILFYNNKKHSSELLDIFSTLKEQYSENEEALGNISFHEGEYYLYTLEDNKSANRSYKTAHEHLIKVFPPYHEVFSTLKELIAKTSETENNTQ